MGIIVFRINANGVREYLLIRRKDSIGYVEFMRGKYNIYSKLYLTNIISEMTNEEKERLLTNKFDTLWKNLWGNDINTQYRGEEKNSRDKFESLKYGISTNNSKNYSLESLINNSNTNWNEFKISKPSSNSKF